MAVRTFAESGISTVKSLNVTPEELAQRAADTAAAEQAATEAAKQAKADQKRRDAAIAHAKSLGFTDDMIRVMYPALG
jgi:hypothetical protein